MNKLACASAPLEVNVRLTTTAGSPQHYSQHAILALLIPGSRLNVRNSPGTRPYFNCQLLKNFAD